MKRHPSYQSEQDVQLGPSALHQRAVQQPPLCPSAPCYAHWPDVDRLAGEAAAEVVFSFFISKNLVHYHSSQAPTRNDFPQKRFPPQKIQKRIL